MKNKRDYDDSASNSHKKRMANRSKEESAPYVVVVHGPPKVGKSSLIKSLVKHYTHGTLTDITNPITITSGGERRIQFVECPNNVSGMIDAAKYADAVIFLIDASYEFEMETFEFLNLLRFRGMPEVIGVLTYLDSFKNADHLEKTKKYLKNRFKREISETAEVFCLCGLDQGMYSKDEIRELASFISHMEFHPLSGLAGHSYVLVDRFEDVTPPEEVRMHNECARDIILYGYLRGSDTEKGAKVHIAGVGDFHSTGVTRVADPFPLQPVDGNNLEVDLHEVTYLETGSYKPGAYLMFEFRGVPSEIISSRPPCQPILVVGITPEEENAGYMQAKVEQHSWQTKSLQTNNPIMVSVGWRRYQTTPVYARKGRHGKYQMLEHTPADVSCLAVFWGPLAPPGTGVVVVQSLADHDAAFRILATGVVLNNHAAKIVKKSKRIGTPCKIFNEIALIQDMFTSDDEIDQFKDAKVKTESGIAGEVNEAATKKLLSTVKWKDGQRKEGIAKCSFESRIKKCDIVYMYMRNPVEVPCIFNPLTTALQLSNRIWQSLDTGDKSIIKQHNFDISKAHVVVIAEEGKIATGSLRECLIKAFEKELRTYLVQKRETLEHRRAVLTVPRVSFPWMDKEKKQKGIGGKKPFRCLAAITQEEWNERQQSKHDEILKVS